MEATPAAVHLTDGNRFADMRVDIAASIAAQEQWLTQVPKQSVRTSLLGNYARLAAYVALRRLRLWEPAVNAGIIRAWFDEFSDYWNRSLGGRRLTIMDFYQMRFLFRKRFARLGKYLGERLEMIDGRFEVSEQSLGRCIGRLKAPVEASA